MVTLVNLMMWLTACGPMTGRQLVTRVRGTIRWRSRSDVEGGGHRPRSGCGPLSSAIQDHLVLIRSFLDRSGNSVSRAVLQKRENPARPIAYYLRPASTENVGLAGSECDCRDGGHERNTGYHASSPSSWVLCRRFGGSIRKSKANCLRVAWLRADFRAGWAGRKATVPGIGCDRSH